MSLAVAWLLGPLSLFATWVVCAAILTAAGLAVRALAAPRAPIDGSALVACFWLGTAATVLLLQLWHLFLPVNALAGVLLLAAGAAGLIAQRRGVREWWLAQRAPSRAFMLLVLLAAWWTGGQGLGGVAAFDTYMYHVPMTDWLRAHPIVPGLANLQERFGFNNASFLLAALVESGPWAEGSPHVLNGTFLVPALALGFGALRALAQQERAEAAVVFDVVLLAPALAMAFDPPIFRSIGPDAPASLAMFAGVSFLLRSTDDTRDGASRAFYGAAAVGSFAAGAAFKLSVAAAAVPFALVALASLVRIRDARALVAAVALAAGIGGLLLVRGVLLSGYPLYPSTAFGMPVDWRVPAEQAHASYAWVSFFARWFDDPQTYNRGFVQAPCNALSWVRPWLHALAHPISVWRVVLPLAVAAAAALPAVKAARRTDSIAGWLLPALVPAFTIWLVVAPRPLFGFWITWLFAALLCALASPRLRPGRRLALAAIAFAAFTMTLPLLGRGLDAARATSGSNVRAALSVWRVPAEAGSWIQPTRWAYPLTAYATSGGLGLLVPAGNRCGRAPLACTSHPAPNLELRGAGVRDGFRVRGGWQAERWPNPWSGFLAAWRSGKGCR